jgi:hypothetical protein
VLVFGAFGRLQPSSSLSPWVPLFPQPKSANQARHSNLLLRNIVTKGTHTFVDCVTSATQNAWSISQLSFPVLALVL